MNSNNGRIEFEIALNNQRLQQDVNRSKTLISGMGNTAVAQGRRIDTEFQQMGNSIKSSITNAVGSAKNAILDLTKSMLGLTAVMGSGAFLKSLYDDAKEFSRQMKIVSTISEEVTNDLQGFKEKVLDICSTIAVAPATAAAALYQINSAGHTGAAGLQVLEASAKAAVAGVTETATAADAITTVLNAYGFSADRATEVSDKLFTTVRLGKTTMGELAHSISQVAPVASTFGVSIDEVLAVVSELTKQGVPTATAMTQIRSAITAVTESLGDGAFKTRSLLEAFEEVNAKSKGSENALKTDLGNIRALQAVLMATGKHANETAQFIEEIANSTGATETAFKKMNSTAGAQLTILKNNFLKEFQEMGDGMTAHLGGIAKTLNDAFDSGAMQAFLSVLKDLIIAYGVYKVSAMTLHGVNTMMYNQQIAGMQAILAEKTAAIDADLQEAIAKGRLTTARAQELQKMRAEVEQKIQGLAITAEETRIEAEQALARRMRMQVTVQSIETEIAAKEAEIESCYAFGYAQTAEGLQTEVNTLKKKLQIAQGKLGIAVRLEEKKATIAASAAEALNTAQTQRDTLAKQQNAVATTLLTKVTNGLRNALNSLKAAWATNPLGIVLMAATAVIGLLTSFTDSTDAATEATERFGEAAVKQMSNVDTLTAVINATSKKSKVHQKAVGDLMEIYESYGIELDSTISLTQQLIDKKDELIRKIQEEGEETRKANLLASYQEAIDKAVEQMNTRLQEGFKNAEIDGSGVIDDWDLNVFQDNWEQMSLIVSSVMQSKMEEMAGLTGTAYEEAMTQAIEDLYKVLRDTYPDQLKYGTERVSDIDFRDILDELIEKTAGLKQQRDNLANSMRSGTEATEEDTAAIDYSTMAFDQLFDVVYKTKDKLDDVGNTEAKPDVDSSSIDEATEKATGLWGILQDLTGGFKLPTFNLENIPLIGGLIKTAKANEEKAAADALEAQIVTAMTTRKGTADLLKKVNEKLDTAVAGSADEKRLLAIQKRLQDQKSRFDKMSGKGSKGGKTQAEIASDVEKAQLETDRLLEESERQRAQLMQSLINTRTQNEITLEQDARAKKFRQLTLDQQKEDQDLDNQLEAAIKAEIERQRKFFDAQEKEKKAANSHYAVRNFTNEDIDQTQVDAIIAQYKEIQEQTRQLHQRQLADMLRAEFEDMQSYLRDYGTYQQQKLAIASEYAEKIRKAQSEGERRSLEQERDSKLAGARADELRDTIDWSGVFGGFGGIFNDYLQPILQDAKEYTKTQQFKNSDQASQQALLQAISEMETALGGADKVNFAKLGQDIQKYQSAQKRLREAEETYAERYSAWEKASEDYAKAVEGGTEEEQDAAKKRQQAAEADMLAASEQVQACQTMATEAQNTVSDTARTLKKSVDGVMEGLRGLASGGISSAYQGFITLGKSMGKLKDLGKMGDVMGKISDKLENVPIIGWIVEIIDVFKDGISVVIEGLLDAIFDAVSGIISDVLSGNLFKTIGESLLSGVGKILDSISFGGFSSLFGSGDSDKHYEEDMERLSLTNEALTRAIEDLTEVMEDASVKDVDDLYQHQLDLLNEAEKNSQEQMQRSGKAYSNGSFGIGGHHSSNYKIDKGTSSNDWKRISDIVGRTISGAGDFWTLSSEEMRKVADEAPDLYAKIKALADDGYKDAAQYMDDYIEYAKQREELEEAYYEKLTSYTFDDLRDQFKSALVDMEVTAADFAETFNEMLVNSIAEALMTEKYDPLIKALYEKWAEYMKDGELTDEELAALQADRDAIFNSMSADREFLDSLLTSGSQGQGSSKGFATASQDSIDELNGRFTAVQMDTSVIRETLSGIGATMAAMNLSAVESKATLDEIRTISLLAIDHLEAISKNTHELYEMNDLLGKIEKYTRKL